MSQARSTLRKFITASSVYLYKTDKSVAELKAIGGPVSHIDRLSLINYTYEHGILTEFYKAVCTGALTPPRTVLIDQSKTAVQWVASPDDSFKMVIDYFVKPKANSHTRSFPSYYHYILYCRPSDE